MLISFALASVAAVANAASNVLQREANREEPASLQLRPRLVWDLLHKPVWLAGFGAVVASFVLMAAALRTGQISAVQPVIVLELPLALIGAQWVFGSRLRRREWSAAALLTAGLAGLIGFLDPRAGSAHVSWLRWLAGAALSVLVIAVLVLASRGGGAGRRAGLLGAATGVTFGLTAALMKGMTQQFQQGIIGVVTGWQTYGMIAAGVTGMLLLQSALNAGRLIAAQPGVTLLDPLTAILWGVLVFSERISSGAYLALSITSGVVMAAGGVLLATSPLLTEKPTQRGETGSNGSRAPAAGAAAAGQRR